MAATLAPDLGRNDPCPCGSGEKFKRCCLDAAAALGSPAGETPAPSSAREPRRRRRDRSRAKAPKRPALSSEQLGEELGALLKAWLRAHPEAIPGDGSAFYEVAMAQWFARQLGDRRPDRLTEPRRRALMAPSEDGEVAFSYGDVERGLALLRAVGFNMPAARPKHDWRAVLPPSGDVPFHTALAARGMFTADTQRRGERVAHDDVQGRYEATEPLTLLDARVLAALGALRARLVGGTIGRLLMFSLQQLGEQVFARKAIGQADRQALAESLLRLQRVQHRATVTADRRDGYANEQRYAMDWSALDRLEWRCCDGEWREREQADAVHVEVQAEREAAGARVTSPWALLGSGPTVRVSFHPDFETGLERDPTYVNLAVLRELSPFEARVMLRDKASVGPAMGADRKPVVTDGARSKSFYDARKALNTLGLRDENTRRVRRRLRAARLELAAACQDYSEPWWTFKRGRDGAILREGEDERALTTYGNDVDASGGRGLRPSWQRRPVCERLRDRALDVDELVSAKVTARGQAKALQRERAAAGEPTAPSRTRRGQGGRGKRSDLRRFGNAGAWPGAPPT